MKAKNNDNDDGDDGGDTRLPVWEVVSITDNTGAYNAVVIAYWLTKGSYTAWVECGGRDFTLNSWFLEVFFPLLIEQYEMVFSHNPMPGERRTCRNTSVVW